MRIIIPFNTYSQNQFAKLLSRKKEILSILPYFVTQIRQNFYDIPQGHFNLNGRQRCREFKVFDKTNVLLYSVLLRFCVPLEADKLDCSDTLLRSLVRFGVVIIATILFKTLFSHQYFLLSRNAVTNILTSSHAQHPGPKQ